MGIAFGHFICARMPHVKKPVVLKLRQLKNARQRMLAGSPTDNLFTEEFCKLFLKTVHILDYAVMKYVDKDCETLSKQEHGHAKMHLEGQKDLAETDRMARWEPITWLFHFLLLGCGRTVGIALAGGVEAS